MNADPNIVFVLRHAVGGVALEVVPCRFDRIEFRGILRKEFRLQARVVQEHLSNDRPLMDLALVPHQDDRPGHMLQEAPQDRPHVDGLEVLVLKRDIDTDPLADRADGKDSQRRDAVVPVVVVDHRRFALGPPGSPARGDEQKAAFIQEGQMGPKSSRVFLYAASDSASNGRWPPRRAAWPAIPEPGKTSNVGEAGAIHDWDVTAVLIV